MPDQLHDMFLIHQAQQLSLCHMCCMGGYVCQGLAQRVIFTSIHQYTSPFEGKHELLYKAYTPWHLIHFCVLNV